MARRSSTSTGSARNESDPSVDNASDPGDNNSADSTSAQGAGAGDAGAGDAVAPAKRRKRGPNKPKPGTFIVETNARMNHEQIIKLLTAHANAQLGGDVAARMVLQVLDEGECRPLGDVLPQGATLQFATVVRADG